MAAQTGFVFSQIGPFDVHGDSSTLAPRWKRWLARFENSCVAWDITDAERKKAMLLDRGGDDLFEIYETLTMPTAAQYDNDYKKIVKAFEDYFLPKKNPEYEIFQFRRTVQHDTETIDSFVTRLRKLVVNCGYDDQAARDNEIKHQIIQGGKNGKVRRHALQEEMTLEKIITFARSLEVSEREAHRIENDVQTTNSVNKLSQHSKPLKNESRNANSSPWVTRRNERTGRDNRSREDRRSKSKTDSNRTCFNCGRKYPHTNLCPAKDKECHYCHETGHFISCCRKLRNKNRSTGSKFRSNENSEVKHVNEQDSDSDTSVDYLFNIHIHDNYGGKLPFAELSINNKCIRLMLDSGATCNILNRQDFDSISESVTLMPTHRNVFAYGKQQKVDVLGTVEAKLNLRNETQKLKFIVVNTNDSSILGYSSATQLGFIQVHPHYESNVTNTKTRTSSTHVTEITSNLSIPDCPVSVKEIINNHADVFKGVGKFNGKKVKLHINSEIKPVSQSHRRIPYHLRKRSRRK